MTSTTTLTRRFRVNRDLVLLGTAVLVAEALAVAGYLLFAPTVLHDPLILVYPFIWINVGLFAIATTRPVRAPRDRRLLAVGLAGAYFAVLAVASGMVGPGAVFRDHFVATGLGVTLATLPPGWGPALIYGGEYVTFVLVPYEVVGYVALTYLVYVTILDTAGTAVSGLIAVFSCVGCVWPVVGLAIAGVFGGTAGVAAAITGQAYGISTIVFLSAVALLYWRPAGPPRPFR